MAEMTRSPDYLRITASTARRVRNLETGVHPTSSGLNYYDTFGPAPFPNSEDPVWSLTSIQTGPGWQRRMGIVQTFGFLAGQWNASDDEHFICRLPPEARPRVPVNVMAPMTAAEPYFAFIRVDTGGFFYLGKPPNATLGVTCNVYLTGVSWSVN